MKLPSSLFDSGIIIAPPLKIHIVRKKQILLIDDSRPILCLLESVLSKNYNIYAVDDGLMAMSWLEKGNRPSLIISDLQMPNIDGWELIENLSASAFYGEIPILVLSGSDESIIRDRALELGLAGYATKPFDPVKLLEKVNDLLSDNGKPRNGRIPISKAFP